MQVFFVVGNHELWLTRREKQSEDGAKTAEDGGSVEKLVEVHRACEVRTLFGGGGGGGGVVVFLALGVVVGVVGVAVFLAIVVVLGAVLVFLVPCAFSFFQNACFALPAS